MFKIIIHNVSKKYDYEELIKVFLNPEEFYVELPQSLDEELSKSDLLKLSEHSNNNFQIIEINTCCSDDKNEIKAELYNKLSELTGERPPWGILTGVRPVKLAGELIEKHKNETHSILKGKYLLSDEKAKLIIDTYLYQQRIIGKPLFNDTGIYIGIPFCPTRCLYCSFTSNQVKDSEIDRYLIALHREIDYSATLMKERGYCGESLYVGGGTPTTLNEVQLKNLLSLIDRNFEIEKLKELTVEAGRPDTITLEKLKILEAYGVDRISINPQSMKDKTLELIGRSHSSNMTREAMKIARKVNIPVVNMDVIAGLPEESPKDFEKTLMELVDYGAENITVHTLAVKRASKLIEEDKDYHYKQGKIVSEMLDIANDILKSNGYTPYYLYRQKHMAGAMENIGWCKNDTACIYNIRIMEEAESILALGAGGISKQYYPLENRLERVANVSNYEIYIERLEEMLERKNKNLFIK